MPGPGARRRCARSSGAPLVWSSSSHDAAATVGSRLRGGERASEQRRQQSDKRKGSGTSARDGEAKRDYTAAASARWPAGRGDGALARASRTAAAARSALVELGDRDAAAEQVAIAVDVVDARRPAASTWSRAARGDGERRLLAAVGVPPVVGCRPPPPCAARASADCRRDRRGRPRRRGSRRGSRSSRRRSGRARPWARSRSARPSACRRPESSSSARGSRSPSAAWRRRRR